jgi:hypothetical protein
MSSPKVECPGCGGEMSKGSRTCASCRKRGVQIGVQAIVDRGGPRSRDFDQVQRFDRYRRAYNGKCQDLGRALDTSKLEVKQAIMKHASDHFGRQLRSFNELELIEAGWVLDRLEEQLDALALAGSAAE